VGAAFGSDLRWAGAGLAALFVAVLGADFAFGAAFGSDLRWAGAGLAALFVAVLGADFAFGAALRAAAFRVVLGAAFFADFLAAGRR